MGKHEKYVRSYKPQWAKEDWAKDNFYIDVAYTYNSSFYFLLGWLKEYKQIEHYNPQDSNEAYCMYCRTSLRAHHSDLKKHATTQLH